MTERKSISETAVRRPSVATDLPAAASSRRGSGNLTLTSGQTITVHTRVHGEDGLIHAAEKTIEEYSRKFEALFSLTAPRLRMIVAAIEDALHLGLAKAGQVVPMIPTFVFGWPTGTETGDYLAVDLGGTNLRVCLVTLQGGGKFELTQTKYRLTEEQKQEDGEKLLQFCAECVASFVNANVGEADGLLKRGQEVSLGFTFSYPCTQERIDEATLIRWTKGFGAPNIEGHDVAALFRRALAKQNLPVTLTAVINDTTGTLVASRYVNSQTRIGVIFGTGCNAAYMEKVKNIPKMKKLGILNEDPEAEVAINCEWGAFDSFKHQYLPRTKYDEQIDLQSNKPHEQAFEKLISGRYLGEIMRLILCELIDEGVLFLGQNTYKLENSYSFDTAFLSLMETDPTDELLTIIGLFTYFFGLETTIEERRFFRTLAKLISRRAAYLSACGIAALVNKMGCLEEGCAVAADGSLYSKYPGFKDRVHDGLTEIFGKKGQNVETVHAEDGSGVGSAIIAAMTEQRKKAQRFVHF